MAAKSSLAVEPVLPEPRSWCARKVLDRRSSCCATVDGPPPDRPDLAVYSQQEQLSLGLSPTWDSPDIVTNYWQPFALEPETQVTVRNLSPSASAVNAQVLLYTSVFGLGMPRSLLSTQLVNLGPGQARTLLFPLTQALLNAPDQRIGTQVRIIHPADQHLVNNTGAQLLADAYTSKVGRSFTVNFPVMNSLAAPAQISLSVLANALGAVVQPGTRLFSPLEQVMASLTVNVPGSTHGTGAAPLRSDVSVAAFSSSGALIDGLTYVVWIDD